MEKQEGSKDKKRKLLILSKCEVYNSKKIKIYQLLVLQ